MRVTRPTRGLAELYAALRVLQLSLPAVVPDPTPDDDDSTDRIRAKLDEVRVVVAEMALRRGLNVESLFAPPAGPKPVTLKVLKGDST